MYVVFVPRSWGVIGRPREERMGRVKRERFLKYIFRCWLTLFVVFLFSGSICSRKVQNMCLRIKYDVRIEKNIISQSIKCKPIHHGQFIFFIPLLL